jgi:hypothetical protein
MASTTCNGKPPTNLLAAAAAYLQLGWLPIPVGFRTKIPPLDDWETLRPTTDRLTQLFPPGQEQNVGLLLGTPSGGLVDVDLDVEEAVVASRFLLPKTPLRHGRPGNPHSHFWYRLADPPAKAQTAFKDADGTMLLEVRSTGRQTVVPPSVHEDGGQLTWESWGQPTVLAADQLLAAAGTVAAAALLARHWPGEGGRQDAALALAGGLLRAGWAVETSERFLEAVATAAGDEEVRMRIDTVARTKEKIDTDEPATGWPALGQLVSEPVVRQVRLWLRAPESTAPWPVPIPLREVPDVLPFPVGVLPAPIQRLVEEIAWAMNCPLDFPGVAVLALAGGALANSRHLAITRTHLQSPCLYACWVARPGSLKSAPLKFLRRPFDRRQQLYLDDFQREIEAWEEADEDDRGPKPVLRRCIVSDITTESLGIILCENPRGVLMVRNEAAALLAGMNQYKGGKGHDRQVYLNLWDGDTIIIDRKSDKSRHGAPLYVGDPFTAIVGTLQPDVLPALRGESAHGQTTPDDGFRDRFLIVYPPERPAVREQWRDIGMAAQTLWQDVVERLLGLAMVTDDARPRPFFVNLTPCGRLAWEAFTARHAEEVNHPDFPNHLFGPWSKLRGYGARLALILHYLRWATGEAQSEEVDGESMHRAEGLVDYFKSHARKVAAAMDADPQVLEARKLFQWIVAQRLERFQKRQAHAALRGSFPTVEDLETALRVLERYGVVRPGASRDRPGPGRKPSPFYEVNPAALALTVSSQSPSACVPKRDAAGDSVYSVNSVQELAVCPQVGDGSSFSAEPGPSDPGRPAPLASARGPQNTQNPQNRSASGVAPFWNESARDAQNTQNPQNRSPAWDRPGATPDSVDSVDSVNEERSFAVVRNDRELPSVLQALEESELVALDLETTGLNPRQDRARLLSLAMPERGNYVIDLFHVDPRPAFEMLAEKIVIGHNLIFDLGFLARLGFTPGAVRDTLLLSQILSAGQRQSHTLADVVERHLGQKMDKTEQKGDCSGTLTDAQLRYAAADVDVLLPLHQTLEQEIRTADLTRVADLEHRCLPALVWLAGAGVGFDQDGWLALATAAAEEAEELLGRLHQTAPPPPQTSLFGNSRNWTPSPRSASCWTRRTTMRWRRSITHWRRCCVTTAPPASVSAPTAETGSPATPPTVGCTPAGCRSEPTAAAWPAARPTCKTCRAARSIAGASPRLLAGCWSRPTTRRSSCGSPPGSLTNRPCSTPTARGSICTR